MEREAEVKRVGWVLRRVVRFEVMCSYSKEPGFILGQKQKFRLSTTKIYAVICSRVNSFTSK